MSCFMNGKVGFHVWLTLYVEKELPVWPLSPHGIDETL